MSNSPSNNPEDDAEATGTGEDFLEIDAPTARGAPAASDTTNAGLEALGDLVDMLDVPDDLDDGSDLPAPVDALGELSTLPVTATEDDAAEDERMPVAGFLDFPPPQTPASGESLPSTADAGPAFDDLRLPQLAALRGAEEDEEGEGVDLAEDGCVDVSRLRNDDSG